MLTIIVLIIIVAVAAAIELADENVAWLRGRWICSSGGYLPLRSRQDKGVVGG